MSVQSSAPPAQAVTPPDVRLPETAAPKSAAAKLIALAGGERGGIVRTVLAALADAAAGIAIAVLAARLIGALRLGTATELAPYLWPLALAVALKALFAYLATRIGHDTSFGIMAELRSRLYSHLETLAPGYLVQRRTGDLVSTSIADVETLELFYAHNIPLTAVALLVPMVILVVVATVSLPVAVPLAVLALAAAIVPRLVKPRLERQADALRRELGDVNAQFVDSLQGLPTLSAFGHEAAQSASVAAATHRAGAASVAVARLSGLQSAASEIIAGAGLVVVLVVGGTQVAAGALPLPAFLILFMLSIQLFQPILQLNDLLERLHPALAAARRVFAILEERPQVVDTAADAPTRPADSTVAFRDVTFAYAPGLPPAVQDVSFEVPAGKCVALVGHSGAGKSTIVHLLQRFWDPRQGAIELGGVDLRELPLAVLHDQIAVVAQDTYLFNTSVLENLRLGRPTATQAEVEAAARAANAHEFISALPEGYDTRIGERGARLSGGQKQRLAIARALLKDAPVLLLDEATSNVDTETEQVIQEALARLMAGRTSLVIAHRLATIRNADLVLVLDRGRLVESGPPDALLARGGQFAALLRAQGLARVSAAS